MLFLNSSNFCTIIPSAGNLSDKKHRDGLRPLDNSNYCASKTSTKLIILLETELVPFYAQFLPTIGYVAVLKGLIIFVHSAIFVILLWKVWFSAILDNGRSVIEFRQNRIKIASLLSVLTIPEILFKI